MQGFLYQIKLNLGGGEQFFAGAVNLPTIQ